ncbi:MAG: AIR synthase-related protein, partial [bacterium]
KAEEIFFMMSTYRDAMLACQIGVRDDGVSAMHDATECGIYGGVFELAIAGGVGVRLNKDTIEIDDRVKKVCDLFEIDPFKSISEGTLLIAVRPHKAEILKEHLESNGIKAFICGEFLEDKNKFVLIENGNERPLEHPKVDPFWAAFYRALKSYSQLENES